MMKDGKTFTEVENLAELLSKGEPLNLSGIDNVSVFRDDTLLDRDTGTTVMEVPHCLITVRPASTIAS